MLHRIAIYIFCFLLCVTKLNGQSTAQAVIQYNQQNREFYVANLSPPALAAGADKAPYWSFFWEFGDGHYSTADRPRYCYEAAGMKQVRLSLVPHYSHSATMVIKQIVFVGGNCRDIACLNQGACNGQDYDLGRKLVKIETNSENELVPNNEIQVAVHYRMPSGVNSQEGDLFLFYQDRAMEEELHFPPLSFSFSNSDRHRLINSSALPSARSTLESGGPEYRLARSIYQSRANGQPLVYRCRLAPGQEGRIFLTLSASQSLQNHNFNDRRAVLTTGLKAIWIPRGIPFDESRMLDNYELKMLSVHDPNRLRIISPNNRATFVPNHPQTFEIEVDFQNRGGRPAKKVEVAIDWPDNLDPYSIQVLGRVPVDSPLICPECPDGPYPNSPSSCFQLDTSRVAELSKVYFIFHNVMIHGKREPGRGGAEYTKGKLRFSARSNNRQQQQTIFNGGIVFDGEAPIATGQRRRNWRHRGFGLKLGYNLSSLSSDFESISENFRHWFHVGLYYRRSALKEGFSPFAGFEFSISGNGLRRDRAFIINPTLDLPLLQLVRESVSIQSLDLQVMAEARIGGIFGLTLGLGPSIPLWAKSDILFNSFSASQLADSHDEYFEFFNEPENISTEAFNDLIALDPTARRTGFGLFNEDEPAPLNALLNPTSLSSFQPGAIVSIGGELGALNKFAIGFRHSFRFYPNTYLNEDFNFKSLEAYVRINLTSFGKAQLGIHQ